MIKKYGVAVAFLFSVQVASVYALTPTLSVSPAGSGDNVLVTVKGDPNADVYLNYYSTTLSGVQNHNIGRTTSTGDFWTTISTLAYNLSSNGPVSVLVNGYSSNQVTWPVVSTGGNSNSNTLSLSQTGVTLSVGQSSTITANNVSSLFVFNNTNPSIANISLNGSQITITANAYGSSVITVCSQTSTSVCSSIYVTVQNGGSQTLTFSQSNPTIAVGQTIPITIYGGTGIYIVSNNSNVNAVQTSINGATINLSALSGTGQSSITVCTSDMISCGIINAVIGNTNSSPISFSNSYPSLSLGQSVSVTLSGSTGSYYVSSNSNSSAVQASISGSTLSLFGNMSGTAAINICSSSGSCGVVNATVSSGGGGGAITLSQSSLVLAQGQSVSVTVSGGSVPYSVSVNDSYGTVSSSVNGNVVTITGIKQGSTSVNVCSASGGCTALLVVVNGTTSTVYPILSQSVVNISPSQSTTITLTGSGSYYVSQSSNASIATVTISGAAVNIYGNTAGTDIVTLCQSSTQCNTLSITVSGSGTTATPPSSILISQLVTVGQTVRLSISPQAVYILPAPMTTPFTTSISGTTISITGVAPGSNSFVVCSQANACTTLYVIVVGQGGVTDTGYGNGSASFISALKFGNNGNEVLALQNVLRRLGFLTATPNGHFGPATVAALKKYQASYGLEQTGAVGPKTKERLNKE